MNRTLHYTADIKILEHIDLNGMPLEDYSAASYRWCDGKLTLHVSESIADSLREVRINGLVAVPA